MTTTVPQKLTNFYVFKENGEEAVMFYTSLFDDGEVLQMIRARAGEPGWPEGRMQYAVFSIGGREMMCINTPPPGNPLRNTAPWDEFGFDPSMAIYVRCTSHEEFDRLFKALSEEGTVRLPVGSYGFSPKFTWLDDRFGISWRLNLSAADSEEE